MKKLTRMITISLVLAALCLSAIGCGNSGGITPKPSITYTEYTTAGVTYELPSSWDITQDEEGAIDGDSFSAIVAELPTSLFADFCERHIIETLEGLNTTNITYEKKTCGGYQAYDYEGTATITGESTPIKVLCIHTGDTVVCFMYICNDTSEDYNAIYNHLINSIN